MKLSYYGYVFTEVATDTKTLMSAEGLFRAFCLYQNPIFKNTFTHNGENVFLLNAVGNLYLFLQTRSHELIKKIDSSDISIGEIYTLLEAQEKIGFASYVYINGSHLGFASTIMAPRVVSFVAFANEMLRKIGMNSHQMSLIPLLHQVSRADALVMPFMGKSTIQVNKSSTLFDDIRNLTGGTAEEFSDVDSFEITLKPTRRHNIKPAVNKFVSAVPDEGLEKMIIRAKDELQGSLVDLYLAGKGIIADHVDTSDERLIAQRMTEKMENNPVLMEKVAEHEQNGAFSTAHIDGIVRYSDVVAWAAAFPAVQAAD